MTGFGRGKFLWWAAIAAVLAAPVSVTVIDSPASAQTWQWPWEQDERPRRRPARRPVNPSPSYGPNAYNQAPGNRPPVCLQLEQRLAEEANRGAQSRGQLPAVKQGIRQARSTVRRLERELERRDCFDQFLFTKTLRRTKRCIALDRDVRRASRQLNDLNIRRQQMLGGGDKSYQDEIIRELARNNCGGVYSREARRRNPFQNFWQDEDSGDRGFRGNSFAGLPFATYRTVCVRLCDGYYFPVSFSTLPTYFGRDADVCQSQCAAPTALYFHQNPGQSVDQMVSQRDQRPYSELKTAFRYRKEYVTGCSCKQAEYVAADGSSVPQNAAARSGAGAFAVPKPANRDRGALSPVR